jgi:Ca-activated chloride channel family protein
MVSLSFAYPWMLMLLWLVPGLGFWWYAAARRRERNLAVFVSPTMQKRLQPRHAASRTVWQSVLLSLALFLMLFAASRPRWGVREEMVFKRGRDLVIALDVSRSMLAADVYPNRLGRAKVDLIDLIHDLEGDRAALIAFRHKAVLMCPLTTDYAYLKHSLDSITVDSAPRGETDIGDAIAKSIAAFETADSNHKAIVLISDGEDLSGRAIALAEQAAESGIPIFTVGLGDQRGARIPDAEHEGAFARHDGSEVVTRLDNETLDRIAQISGGAYVPVGTASTASTTLGALYRTRLSQILAQDLEETLQRRHVERYQLFLLPAFVLFLAGTCLSRGRLVTGGRKSGEPSNNRTAEQPNSEVRINRQARETKNISPSKSSLRDISGAATAIVLAGLLWAGGSACAQTTGAVPIGRSPLATTTNSLPGVEPDSATTNALPDIPPGRSGARMAQRLFRKGQFAEAATVYGEAAKGSTRDSQRDFEFNAAIAWYRAGEYGKAAAILRRLVQSRHDMDAAAASGLGAALYRQAEIMDGAVDADTLEARETTLRQSAAAFQEALRAVPDASDDRANLALMLKALPEAGEKALVARLMQEHGQTEPFALLGTMLSEQRTIIEAAPQVFTNETPAQIPLFEALAARQKANAQLWIPLKGKLLGMMQQAPQEQLGMMNGAMDNIQDSMLDAGAGLRDLDPAAYGPAADAESNLYGIWKQMADYTLLLQEDLRRQSNAVHETRQTLPTGAPPTSRNLVDQQEASTLTPLFVQRLPEPAPEDTAPINPGDPDGQPDPGAMPPTDPGLSVEAHSNILALAEQAIAAQQRAVDHLKSDKQADALAEELRSYDLLKQIEELIPKPENQQQEQPQEQEQPPDQEEQPEQEPPEQEQPEQEQPEPQPQEQELSEEELQKLLERALEREKEYEEKQRERNRSAPLSPRDRDW